MHTNIPAPFAGSAWCCQYARTLYKIIGHQESEGRGHIFKGGVLVGHYSTKIHFLLHVGTYSGCNSHMMTLLVLVLSWLFGAYISMCRDTTDTQKSLRNSILKSLYNHIPFIFQCFMTNKTILALRKPIAKVPHQVLTKWANCVLSGHAAIYICPQSSSSYIIMDSNNAQSTSVYTATPQ